MMTRMIPQWAIQLFEMATPEAIDEMKRDRIKP